MPLRSRDPITIAGTGRVAQSLGRILLEHGEPVVAIAGRNLDHARAAAAFIGHGVKPAGLAAPITSSTRLLIAVSDSAVEEVARLLADAGMKRGIALHTWGGMGPEALAPLASAGVSCGAIHPLQTFATPEQGLSLLPGATFAIDGDPPALAWAERIARLLGGETLRIPPERRPLYHAAAVMASNYVVALMDAAAILMSAAGVDEKKALRALGPLAEASLANVRGLGPVEALTGPVQRGDLVTLRGHLRSLGAAPATVHALYRSAGLHALDIAVRRGLEPERARLIEKLLREGEEEHA